VETSRADDRPLQRTPTLERVLERLSAKLTRQIWLFGLGTLLAWLSAWLLFAFLADYGLRVPQGVRVLHTLVAVVLPCWCAWRYLLRPLGRRPDRASTAVLLERARPQTSDLFVSAVQLQQRERVEGARELIDDVLREAERQAHGAQLQGVLDESPARKRAALGGGSVALLAGLSLAFPELARTFVLRAFDPSVRWPQRTHLTLEIPLGAEKAAVESKDGELFVRVARGSDVPILVRASGLAPDEIQLQLRGADALSITASSDDTYRTLLRSLQQDVELRASGGDDDGSNARARIQVLSPPDVSGLAMSIEPPAYSGLPARVEFDRDVEVLAGSRLQVSVLTQPAEARAQARLLPEDRLVELGPLAFPAREAGAEPLPGRGFELLALESLRLRFELQDEHGLKNPDPGLFGVRVFADEKPQVSIYSPARAEFDTLVGGWIPLRARASDDFGIAAMQWSVRSPGDESAPPPREIEWRVIADGERESDETRAVVALAGARLEVTALGDAARPVVEGAQYTLEVLANDNRPGAAEAGAARSAALHVRVVSTEEFLRRTQDRLARVRLSVGELESLARDKGRRARELVASLESDAPERGAAASELAALHSGARRVEGDAQAIARELCSIAEAVLYARLDEEADSALMALDTALSTAPRSGSFPWDAWRGFGRGSESGRGRATLAGQLAGLVDLGLTIDLDDARAAAKAAERAAQSVDIGEIHAALGEHVRLAEQLDGHVQDLLARLAEWDNFQSILSLTKDILNRQKALRERAKAALGGK